MRKLLMILAITASIITKAQIYSVSLQASCSTCSMCSNSINKVLKTHDFVLKVDAHIKKYSLEISFKRNCINDFDKIPEKGIGSGFHIAAL